MKVGIIPVVLLLAACRKPANTPVYASTEGPYDAGGPARLRPSRHLDSTMLRDRTGSLVVRVTSLGRPVARAHVQLFPNDAWRDRVRDDSTDVDGSLRVSDLPAGVYSGVARRLGYHQVLFRLAISAGYADTLELTLAWPAR